MKQEEINALNDLQSRLTAYKRVIEAFDYATETPTRGVGLYIDGKMIGSKYCPPDLFDKVAELVRKEYASEVARMTKIIDSLVICQGINSYKPINILE